MGLLAARVTGSEQYTSLLTQTVRGLLANTCICALSTPHREISSHEQRSTNP